MTPSACRLFLFFFLSFASGDLEEGSHSSVHLGGPHYRRIILIGLIQINSSNCVIQQLTNHIRWITGRPVREASGIIILLVHLFTRASFPLLQFITLIGGDKTRDRFRKQQIEMQDGERKKIKIKN